MCRPHYPLRHGEIATGSIIAAPEGVPALVAHET